MLTSYSYALGYSISYIYPSKTLNLKYGFQWDRSVGSYIVKNLQQHYSIIHSAYKI